jgi:hypothetical protein
MSKSIVNNTSKRLNIIFVGICLQLLISSCKKFVEIDPSTTTVVTSNVFDKNSTATAAQLAIYAKMQSFPFQIDWTTGLSSDEIKNHSTSSTTSINLYSNKLNAVNDAGNIGIWSPAYNFIYQANALSEALANSPGVTESAKNQLIGEADFVRAYWNFYLVNLYGDVPLVTSADYTINAGLIRTPKDQIYQQIVTDLVNAQNLLNTNFVDASDTVITSERVRPTKGAATALLARVYLYTGEWAKAAAQATAVINNTSLFSLPTKLDSVFLKNNKEAILQLMVNSNTKYTTEGSNFILTTNPVTTAGSTVNVISAQLLNSFEAGDARKAKWIGTYTSTTTPITTYYFSNKYKANSATIAANASLANSEYSTLLRLAEQYLIRAEARAMQNQLSDAVADLNIIRNRAGLPNYPGIMDQPSVLAAIMHERQVELFTEGHRWLDLKRTNTVDAVMSTVATQKGSSWQSYQQLYPIPVTDVQNSAEMIAQNPNY